jgi:DNA polymerase
MNMPSPIPEPNPSARDLLAFYLEAGVDCALNDEPVNRLSEPDAVQQVAETPPIRKPLVMEPTPVVRSTPVPPPAPDVAIASARDAARTAPTLDALRTLLDNFDGCALKTTATRLVFADGNPKARVMFVGEAPGRDEDLSGLPVVGRSGKLLDLMLRAIGLDRTTAYIANVIPWRPPGNRDPSPQETQICLPFIKRQIELVDPDVLVCLGKPSSQAVLDFKDGIMRTRGRWHNYDTGTRTIRAMATFHPAYLLRQPIYKRMAWQDLRSIAKALKETATAGASS